jgi:2-polyprenyl-6-hydroxyphenyl methylase/3-demethylubiquinone-9 3-methyltransferase
MTREVSSVAANVDPQELKKFGELAHTWWDPNGPSRPLHDLNPIRLGYVRDRVALKGARVCDVGCGGGLLAEALAGEGADVVATDLAPEVIAVARLHALESGAKIDYRLTSVEALAAAEPESFGVVTCMEMIEHVPDPAAVIAACAALLEPGGKLFVSTLNRTPQSFLAAIVGAEYIAGLLPRGTHHYRQFIRPSELAAWLRGAGLVAEDVSGLLYDPLLRRARVGDNTAVNYLCCASKPA